MRDYLDCRINEGDFVLFINDNEFNKGTVTTIEQQEKVFLNNRSKKLTLVTTKKLVITNEFGKIFDLIPEKTIKIC